MADFNEALRVALKANELGEGDPYKLNFAGLANSGASFGVFQNDTAANASALETVRQALEAAKAPIDVVGRALGILHRPCTAAAFNPRDGLLDRCNASLASGAGRVLVDQLDEITFKTVLKRLEMADAAVGSIKALTSGARIAVGLWVNMTGEPTSLLSFVTTQPPGGIPLFVIMGYLMKTKFFSAHPQNAEHFEASVQAGLNILASPE